MFENIVYYQILGKPLIMYLGILTLLSVTITALIAVLTVKGIKKYPISWHTNMAIVSLILAFIHGLLGVLAYL